MKKRLLIALTLLWLLGSPWARAEEDEGWQAVGERDGITVYNREVPDSDIQKIKAIGTFDAPVRVQRRLDQIGR